MAKASIALYPPKGWRGLEIEELAPDPYMFNLYKTGVMMEDTFKRLYHRQLEEITQNRIEEIVKQASCGNDIALLCYEAPGDFCHRKVLADFMGWSEWLPAESPRS